MRKYKGVTRGKVKRCKGGRGKKKRRKVLVEGEGDNVSNLGIALLGGRCNKDKVERTYQN